MVIARSRRAAGNGSYLAIAAFVIVYLVDAVHRPRPLWVVGFYLVTSLICFILYSVDKRRARFGGWPGAIVAHQMLLHKTQKVRFRKAFWATVIVNVGLFVVLSTPMFDQLLAQAVEDFSIR